MTELNEALYIEEPPLSRLAMQICRLAREGEDVFSVNFSDTDSTLYVTVGTERAKQAVLRLAPEAIVAIIE